MFDFYEPLIHRQLKPMSHFLFFFFIGELKKISGSLLLQVGNSCHPELTTGRKSFVFVFVVVKFDVATDDEETWTQPKVGTEEAS